MKLKRNRADTTEDDASIVARVKNGDEKAIEFVYKECCRLVSYIVYKNGGTRDEAKDLYQDVVLVFWQKARSGNLTLTSKISSFVYAIARNLWLKELERKKKVYTEKETSEPIDIHRTEREKIITDCISQLDKKCRKIITYHYYAEMSSQQLADKLKFANSNSAKTQKCNCQKKLSSLLKAQYSRNDFF